MNNLEKSAEIRRIVENEAYKLLSKCEDPEKRYDGEYYMQEFWEIDPIDLHEAVSVHLSQRGLTPRGSQATFFVTRFLESKEYEEMIEHFREEYYE